MSSGHMQSKMELIQNSCDSGSYLLRWLSVCTAWLCGVPVKTALVYIRQYYTGSGICDASPL